MLRNSSTKGNLKMKAFKKFYKKAVKFVKAHTGVVWYAAGVATMPAYHVAVKLVHAVLA
jgi:hypothetical protein